MTRRRSLVLALLPLMAGPVWADEPAAFRAGAAASNITPPLGEPIVGGWEPHPARHVHDELYARCLFLDDGTTQLAIVLCDNVGIPREVYDEARRMIREEIGLPPGQVLMAATHTHSATSARTDNRLRPAGELGEYQSFLARRIADGVTRARNNREPARLAGGTVDVPEEVFNRRWHMAPGDHLRNPFGGEDRVRMNPPQGSGDLIRPAGPVDPGVSFISVRASDGRPIALLANYSLHYVGGVPRGEISADYFGVFAGRIAELLGADKVEPPFVGVLSNGTSGDVNNIDFRRKNPRRYAPYEKMSEVAGRVAAAVAEAHRAAEFREDVTLAARWSELPLEVRKPTAEQRDWANRTLAKSSAEPAWHDREKVYARRVMTQQESPDEVIVPLQAVRIGDMGIAAIPFEVFTETGLEIKEKSPFGLTFTIELANGSFGYLPTPAQHELGGYETWLGTNLVEKEASVKITRSVLGMLGELHDGNGGR